MKHFLVCIGLMVCSLIHAQDYRAFVLEGKTWECRYNNGRDNAYNVTYYFSGDTIVDNRTCKKMYSYNYYNDATLRYVAALYEQDRRVYACPVNSNDFNLLYDFGMQLNDEITEKSESPNVEDKVHKVISVGTIIIRDRSYKCISLALFHGEQMIALTPWIERVGGGYLPLLPYGWNSWGNLYI